MSLKLNYKTVKLNGFAKLKRPANTWADSPTAPFRK